MRVINRRCIGVWGKTGGTVPARAKSFLETAVSGSWLLSMFSVSVAFVSQPSNLEDECQRPPEGESLDNNLETHRTLFSISHLKAQIHPPTLRLSCPPVSEPERDLSPTPPPSHPNMAMTLPFCGASFHQTAPG